MQSLPIFRFRDIMMFFIILISLQLMLEFWDLSDYLGIKIERKEDGTLEWTQPTLIQSILKDLKLDGEGFKNKPKVRTIPASSTVVLTDHADSKDHNPNEFDYRHVIGKLLYLEKSTRPDISCAVHQCARHCANPKIQHTIAIKRIGDLQRKATTLLLHAQRRWPDAINTHLWPYAIRCANETRNTCPTKMSWIRNTGNSKTSSWSCFIGLTKRMIFGHDPPWEQSRHNTEASWPERGVVAPGLISLPSSLVGINRKEEGYFHSSPVSSLSSIVVGGREGRKRT